MIAKLLVKPNNVKEITVIEVKGSDIDFEAELKAEERFRLESSLLNQSLIKLRDQILL